MSQQETRGYTPSCFFSSSLIDRLKTALHYLIPIILILVWSWIIYQPGLSGGLEFDDEINLKPIQSVGELDSFEEIVKYLAQGNAGPLKRPVSMLSFLIDSDSWPVDTVRLKTTNLLIHLVNVCLMACLAYMVFYRVMPDRSQYSIFLLAMGAAVLWSINPMQVSTVSYIVQRMTQLSAMFTILGIIIVLKMETAYFSKNIHWLRKWFLYGFLFGCVFILGILSKENAILMCLLALITIFFIPRRRNGLEENFGSAQTKLWRFSLITFLGLPILLLFVYTFHQAVLTPNAFAFREFTLGERLLTQPRIIWTYLRYIFLPDVNGMGLYRGDQIIKSVSIIQPYTTLLSILALSTVVGAIVKFRSQYPLLAFGAAFFLGGHLLESTYLPLEMYFEHRNYLPSVGLWISVMALFAMASHSRRIATIVLLGVVVGFSMISFRLSIWWGDPLLLRQKWYESQVSERSAQSYAFELDRLGHSNGAKVVLDRAKTLYPGSLALNLSSDFLECHILKDRFSFSVEKYHDIAANAPPEISWLELLKLMFEMYRQNQHCQGIDDEAILTVLNTVIEKNEKMMARLGTATGAYVLAYEIYFHRKNLDKSIHFLNLACQHDCRFQYRYQQAIMLTTAGLFGDALEYLAMARKELNFLERLQDPEIENRVDELEKVLIKAIAHPQ